MSGGAIHLGIGDGQTVARIRPEAFAFAEKHKGQGMSSVMTRNEPFRPRTAPAGRKKSKIGPIPGFDQEKVATLLATVPRVKPEAAENAKKATGSMANILAQAPPKPQLIIQGSQTNNRPRTAPSGPIVHDLKERIVAVVAPRIKAEAERTAALGTHGLVGKLFHESYEEARKANMKNALKEVPPSKNHIQANVDRMRKIQKQARQRDKQKQQPVPVKALWRSDKYSSVEGRVNTYAVAGNRTHAPRDTWQKQPTPNAPRPNTAPQNRDTNFIAKNAQNAWKPKNRIRRSRSVENISKAKSEKEKSQQFYDLEIRGTVPEYLVKRKEELRQANEVKNRKPDPDCPPNHVRLSEDERRRVLTNLQKSLNEKENELNLLPVRQCDTIAYKMRKVEIEQQISELDAAIRTFSKKKVFVRQ